MSSYTNNTNNTNNNTNQNTGNSNNTISTTQNACNQRRINMLFNIPPVRLEKVSPYPDYTSQQLNMRRKVEILKHNKNSTKGRKLTAKETYALINRGNFRGNRLSCPEDSNIPLPTSRSGVPGPIMNLVEDKSVPLYNYITNTLSSAEEITEPKYEWLVYLLSNITCPESLLNVTRIASLMIKESISNSFTTYTYTTPVVYYLTGRNIPIDTSGVLVTAELNNLTSKIFYGDNLILNDYTFLSVNQPTFTISLQPNPSITESTYDYHAKIYAGYMTFSNVYLQILVLFTI